MILFLRLVDDVVKRKMKFNFNPYIDKLHKLVHFDYESDAWQFFVNDIVDTLTAHQVDNTEKQILCEYVYS